MPDDTRGPFFDPAFRAADVGDARAVALAAAVLLAGDRIQGEVYRYRVAILFPEVPATRRPSWQAMPPESAVAEARELVRLAREAVTTPDSEEEAPPPFVPPPDGDGWQGGRPVRAEPCYLARTHSAPQCHKGLCRRVVRGAGLDTGPVPCVGRESVAQAFPDEEADRG